MTLLWEIVSNFESQFLATFAWALDATSESHFGSLLTLSNCFALPGPVAPSADHKSGLCQGSQAKHAMALDCLR